MVTIRESLKKLVEVAKPVPGDEQEFVAKHVIKVFDPQGKDAIHPESPYELILKNVAAVKAPPHAGEDHGHEAPGESEAAYHIPESRDAKIAKLSEMMGKDEDEEDKEEEEDEDEEDEEDEKDEKEMKEAKDVVGVRMHYHNPKTGEKFHEVHFTVPAAEKFRKQHEKAGFKLVKKEAQMAEANIVSEAEREAGYKMSPAVRKAQKESDRLSKQEKPIQAGTLAALKKRDLVKEENQREANDKAREERVSTPRPHTAKTTEGMRYRLQAVKKQIIDKT